MLTHLEAKTGSCGNPILEDAAEDAATMAPHVWFEVYGSELPHAARPFVKWGKRLCAAASSASVSEQGVVGWSRVDGIESKRRTRIHTAKTDKLVNVNGWQWAVNERAQMDAKLEAGKCASRSPVLALFDVLDGFCAEHEERAVEAGAMPRGVMSKDVIDLGDSDADDDDNASADAEEPKSDGGAPPAIGDEWEVEEEDDAEMGDHMEPASDIDTDGDDTEVVEARSAIKCNARLADALPGIVDFKGTEFGAARELLFRK